MSELLPKKEVEILGKRYFLLGQSVRGIYYYLEHPYFKDGQYWGFGNIVDLDHPEWATDLGYTLKKLNKPFLFQAFNEFFPYSVLNEREIWQFLELSISAYTLIQAADLLHCGHSRYATVEIYLQDEGLSSYIQDTFIRKLVYEIELMLTNKIGE